MAEPAALAVRDLEVRYGAVPAVRNLSLEVGKGEIVGLIGPNGAGKSTTLHAIMGLVPARTGSRHVDGPPVLGRTPESIAHARCRARPGGPADLRRTSASRRTCGSGSPPAAAADG